MKPTKAQLEIIQKRLPPEAVLTADMVEVLPYRVFDQELTDRYTVMSDEMMLKLVKDLNDGKAAFNMLHQSRSTLPVGASINGRMMPVGTDKHELHANMYAVVKNPDGSQAVDGKSLADKYNTGAVRAVSAGVQVGFYCCSICGNDIRDYRNCEHIPGRVYQVDEQPKQCIATMTGRNIQNGMAMDCGIYEVSAVTAGGVANAGTLTETFGRYSDGADVSEFKKGACGEEKTFPERILFEAVLGEPNHTPPEGGTHQMDQLNKFMTETYQPLVVQNAQTTAEFNLLTTNHKNLQAQYEGLQTELTSVRADLAAKTAEFDARNQEFADLTAARDQAVADKATLETFRTEYVGVIIGYGTMLGHNHTVEEFAGKTCDELKTTYEAYRTEVAKLPVGQVSRTDEIEEYQAGPLAGVPASVYQT